VVSAQVLTARTGRRTRPLFLSGSALCWQGQEFTDFDPNQQHAEPASQTPKQLAAAFAPDRVKTALSCSNRYRMTTWNGPRSIRKLGTVTLAELLHTWAARMI